MSAVVADAPDTRRVGQAFWLLLLVAMLISGLVVNSRVAVDAFTIVLGVAINFFGFFWVRTDSRARGLRFSTASKLGVILASPIFLPIHLLRTRGFARTAWVIFLFVLKYIAVVLVAYALLLGLSALGVRVLLG